VYHLIIFLFLSVTEIYIYGLDISKLDISNVNIWSEIMTENDELPTNCSITIQNQLKDQKGAEDCSSDTYKILKEYNIKLLKSMKGFVKQ